MSTLARQQLPTFDFDNADPFAPSFLPSKGLFAPSPPPRTTPICTTIIEEEDAEEEPPRPSFSSQRREASILIHPRAFRSDSYSDDEGSDASVLRFPIPPSTLPLNIKPRSHSPARNNSLKRFTAPRPAPSPPPPVLKSCFEDDSATEATPTRSLFRNSVNRPSPPPKPSTSAPLALLKRATSALAKSSGSPPRPTSGPRREKPLPLVPHTNSLLIDQPLSVSPTPSLTSSSSDSGSSSSSSWSHGAYIPVGSIVPAPAVIEDLDSYVETLEMYFPSELWAEPETHHHSIQKRLPTRRSHSRGSSSSSSIESHSRKSSLEEVIGASNNLRPSSSFSDLKRRPASAKRESNTGSVRIASPELAPRLARAVSPYFETYYPSSSSNWTITKSASSSSSTVTPGSRTPTPPSTVLASPQSLKSILKPSKSSPHLRTRSSSSAGSITYEIPPMPTPASPPSAFRTPLSPVAGSRPKSPFHVKRPSTPKSPKSPKGVLSPLSPSPSVISYSSRYSNDSSYSTGSRHGPGGLPQRSAIPSQLLIR